MTTKIPVELSSTPGIVDGSNATAITIDSSENVTLSGDLTIAKATSGADSTFKVASTAASGENDATVIINSGGTGDAMLRFDYESSTDRARIGITTSAQALQFFTAGNNERMRINSSGNVGIGTASPATQLQLLNAGESMIRMGYSTTQYAQIGRNSDGTYEFSCYENGGVLKFGTSQSNNATTERMRITAAGNVGIGTASPNGKLDVVATSGEIFRADANGGAYRIFADQDGVKMNGNVGIGTTSPAQKLSVHGNVNFNTTSGDGNEARHLFGVGGSADPATYSMYHGNGTSVHVHLTADGSSYIAGGNLGVGDTSPAYRLELPNTPNANGQIRCHAVITYSDERIKSNIQTLDYGLDVVKQLKPSQYKHHSSVKEDGQFVKQDEGANDIGFIAQEVLPLIPEVVSVPVDTDKDLYSISYPKLTAVLTKAIQEQQTIIEDLKTRIETLEGE